MNINKAKKEELMKLDGIGKGRSDATIAVGNLEHISSAEELSAKAGIPMELCQRSEGGRMITFEEDLMKRILAPRPIRLYFGKDWQTILMTSAKNWTAAYRTFLER
jgi:hypothetical protein